MNNEGKDISALERAIRHLNLMVQNNELDYDLLEDFKQLSHELKRAQAEKSELKEGLNTFFKFFNHAPYGIFTCDKFGRYLDVNQAVANQVGYSPRELSSMTFSSLLASSNLAQGARYFDKLVKNGASTGELLIRRKNGNEFYMSMNAVKISDNLFIGFTEDVDSHRAVEKALIESEVKNRALTEVTNEAIFITHKGYCIECNPSASKIFGYSYDELIGKFATFIAAPESEETIKRNILAGIETPYEALVMHKDGRKFWAEIEGKNYYYKEKKVRVTSIRDISKRKKYEKVLRETIAELQESEAKNRALSNATNEGIFFLDKGYCVECNRTACKMFGYEYDELIGIFGTDLIAPESRDLVKRNMLSGYEEPYEALALRKDGSTFIAEFEGKAHHYKGKKVRLSSVRDISAQKQAEKDLRDTEEKLKLFADNTLDVLWMLDDKLNYLYASPSIHTLLGYKPEDVIGKSHKNFVTKESYVNSLKVLDDFTSRLSKNSNEVPSAKLEATLIHKDGYEVQIETHANIILDNQNKIKFFSGVSRDITQRKKADEQLQQAADIFENILSGIHLYHLEDLDDDRTLRLVAANPSSTLITGLDRNEIIGKTIDENFPESRAIGLPEKYAEIVRTQRPRTFEAIEYKDDRIGPLALSLKAFPLPNNCVGTSFESISKLKQTQKELEVRNTELNNFVYKVSHDLRAPLTSIKGLLHLSKYEKGPDEYLTKIGESIQKLDDFIRNVLSHSRNLNTTPIADEIDFQMLIDQCFSELSYLPGIKGLKKEIHVVGAKFRNDSIRIFEIFRNIISNAIKYQDYKKEHSFIKINAAVENHEAQIIIEDNGIGIGHAHLEKIFEMFYRATEKSDGSGIGLYIVNQAVKKLAGKIHVESTVGAGTRFLIELPNLLEET